MDGYFTSQFLEGKRNGVHKNLTILSRYLHITSRIKLFYSRILDNSNSDNSNSLLT